MEQSFSPAVVAPKPLALSGEAMQCSVQDVLGQVALIQQIMQVAMRNGEHYGLIPGCGNKPTLLKPGAEKLCLTFKLAPTYDVDERQLERGHREYRVQCTLSSKITQSFIGQGVGTCSTMEAKYRYRGKAGRACPECGANAIIKGKAEFGGGWICFKKKDGCGAKFRDGDKSIEDQSEERQENPDLADQYNTVLKMSKKRALVDAVLTATAASDIFTQDLEDISANLAVANNLAAAGNHQPVSDRVGETRAETTSVDSGANASGGRGSTHTSRRHASMTEEEAWNTQVHFGKNRGMTLRELSPNQREYYFDEWPKVARNSPADGRLLTAIKTLAPLPGDVIDVETAGNDDPLWDAAPHDNDSVPAALAAVDFRETRIHFGKNRGLMLSELSPEQASWYLNEWMPKKEVNGPTSVEDLALINALKEYSAWRANHRPASTSNRPQGGQAAPRPVEKQAQLPVAAEPTPQPEEETQERLSPADELLARIAHAGIPENLFATYLQLPERKVNKTVKLAEDQTIGQMVEPDIVKIAMKLPDHITEFRKLQREAEQEVLLARGGHN